MTPQEIAEQYADSMSVDANKELKQDIRDAIDEAVAAERERLAVVMDNLAAKAAGWPDGELSGDIAAESWVEATFKRAAHWIRSGTTPAREPRAPSPPQSDGG